LLGVSADTLNEYRAGGKDTEYENVFANALFKTVIAKVRVKQELVQDEQRIKASFTKVDDIDYVQECTQLIEAISKYN
jgi:hypothetical protein